MLDMTVAIYIGSGEIEKDERLLRFIDELTAGGLDVYRLHDGAPLLPGTDMLLSVGGDGTFLSASMLVAETDIPIVGVNMGRVGFLSENRPEDVVSALLSGEYTIEERAMLQSSTGACALNEMTIHRSGAAILGVDVSVDGVCLPTYWADGIIVSTSSGSTAYSLSAGGPIVLPESEVIIIAPIAPHNLNVRPLIVPDTASVSIRMHSRDEKVVFTADNRTWNLDSDLKIDIAVAQFSLKRVRLNKSDFINALTEKLHWGDDIRNNK